MDNSTFAQIDWAEVGYIVKDRAETFICREQDLDTPDGTAKQKRAFRASGVVEKVIRSAWLMGEVYLRCREKSPFPTLEAQWSMIAENVSGVFPAEPFWGLFISLWPDVSRAILQEALRFHWEAKSQRRREPKMISLDAELGPDKAGFTLQETLADEDSPAPGEDVGGFLEGLGLTRREHQVAELLATGHEQRDIATALSLSPGRVSQLVNALRKKLPKF